MRHHGLRIVFAAVILGTSPLMVSAQEAAPASPPAAAPAATPAAASDQKLAMQKTVYQINYKGGEDGSGYKGALNNMQNQIDALGPNNYDIRVVLHGDGVGLLQTARSNQALQGLISGLKSQGVRFLVCNNTLTGRKINYEKDLFDVWAEDIVPAGVVEIVRLQQEGFAYLKP